MVRAYPARGEERGMEQVDGQAGDGVFLPWHVPAARGFCGQTTCIPFITTRQLVQLSELLRFI